MDRMTSIASFVKIANAGGFAAAARKLGVSPSTVTMKIQDLEDRLGVRLFNRSTRKVSLTEIGEAYYERCTHILADMDEADSAVHAMHANPSGTLHLNVSISIPFFVAPVIAEFALLYPDVKVSMTMTDRIVDLVEEGIDLAITTMPVPNSNLVMRRVGSFRLLVCGGADYFTRHDVPREPDDLVNHNCMNYTFLPWGSEWRFKSPEGRQHAVHVTGNMQANSFNALRLAAVLGQGLILLPDFLVMGEIKSGKLIPVLTKFFSTEMPIHAIYPHRQHLSANVRNFLDLLAKHFHEFDRQTAGGDLENELPRISAKVAPQLAHLAALASKPARPHV
ncbi:MAG TPA: LysR substrate-binding domain-containing protein [Xanthobacteraceae bacterium]